jgi:hypothetical protein
MRKLLQFLIIIGGPATAALYYFGNKCGSVCDRHSFINPFGMGANEEMCAQVCYYMPQPLFWIAADLTVILIVVYLLFYLKKPNGPHIVSMK